MTSQYIWRALFFVGTVAYSRAGEIVGNNKVLLSSKIEIKRGPAELIGELNHHGALFGRNFFGKRVDRKLYYTKRSLCDGQVPDTPDYIRQDGYVLLVDRGECSFVEKVKNAQKDGATAVFIADDRCLCSKNGLCDSNTNEKCEKIEPVMDDDGSGSDIKIPSMLLLKSDADRLRDEIVSGAVIETSISFPVPMATNGRTEYMLFTSPDDHLSRQFLDSFLEAALSFGTKAVFRPRMLITDGTEKGCRQYEESHVPCKGYCTNYGRYCESPSIYDREHYENKGIKMIVESLRRSCIWNIYGRLDGIGREWWAYVQLWTLQCSYSHYSTSCAESIYEVAGVDKEEVELCMENSGDFRENVLNTLMEISLSDIKKYQVKFGPTLVINGAVINGALTFGNVMEAMCSTFEDTERPEICGKWEVCSDVCSNDQTCILWGDNQECSEYRAPFLSNGQKLFDDDNINLEVVDDAILSSNFYTIPYQEIATKPFEEKDSDVMENLTNPAYNNESERPIDLINHEPVINKIRIHDTSGVSNIEPKVQEIQILTVNDREIDNPSGVHDSKYIPPTSDVKTSNTADRKEVYDKDTVYSHDGQHDLVESIQIYEGSNSGIVIGLGIGFGSAFLLVFIWLLISRDRERQMEAFVASGRIPEQRRRRGLFRSRRPYTYYSDESEETDDQVADNDLFSDEENYYDDGEKLRNHLHDHQSPRSTRRERRRFFRKRSERKSRIRRFRERSSPRTLSELDEDEMLFVNGRVSSIRKKITDEEFPMEHENDARRGK